MGNHAKAARGLLRDTVIRSMSEPGHPHHSCGCAEPEGHDHDYSYLLAALTHAVLAVADAITASNQTPDAKEAT